MLQTRPMTDFFEMPSGLSDFPKSVDIVLNPHAEFGEEIELSTTGGQQYFHWSILNSFVMKDKHEEQVREARMKLAKLLVKLDMNPATKDMAKDVDACLVALSKVE